ncbi:MAG: YjbH domain-containing protein [Rhodoferax sp.]|nr:YjbH domain-containing protein [Rhodoferax sp.]
MRQIAWVVSLWGQVALQAYAADVPVLPGERASDWLLRTAPASTPSDMVQWRVEGEKGPQLRLKEAVLAYLTAQPPTEQNSGLAATLQSLPITGRVVLASSDARWLQGTPKQDPVLASGQTMHRYGAAGSVAVLSDSGGVCLVEQGAFTSVGAYVRACLADADEVDWVWLAQPDGRVSKEGIAAWNADKLATLAPGAWLFAPRRGVLPLSQSENIARILATQAPAHVLFPGKLVLPVGEPVSGLPAAPAEVRPLQLTVSDWGDIGLIQTPSARMESAGTVRTHASAIYPYTRMSVLLQPMDWFELGFRYTDISNALYGPDIAGDQTYKDKSIDVKLRLLKEGVLTPQVAVGLRDLGGTGLFASEYLVANKRWGAWDASVGLGWGYMGARAGVSAPFAFLGSGWRTRSVFTVKQGGATNDQSYFRGDAAVFGGVQWTSPSGKWVFKAELDGNNYQNEPFATTQPQNSPLNWGAVYRYSPNVDFSAYVERGNRAAVGLTLHFNVNQVEMPKPLDPALPRLAAAYPVSLQSALLADEVRLYSGWRVQSAAVNGTTLELQAQTDGALYIQERLDRALVIVNKWAPAHVRHFVMELHERGLPMTRVQVDRAEWLASQTRADAPSLKLPPLEVYAAPSHISDKRGTDQADSAGLLGRAPVLEVEPSYSQILGGPDSFILYQAGVQAKLNLSLQPNTWLSGNVNARVLDNYDSFKFDGPSNLPRVRTDARQYVTTSQFTVPNLQLTHVEDLGGGHYASVYGGYLESMFAGIGGEWLYRPWKGPLAFGVDVNQVRQRSFAQNFGLRDYGIATGHATAYWDTGWNDLQVKLQVGRYLAGDVGATLDVRRVFSNGTTIGAWATKTNISAAQFGEGSFDKGIYVSIPFDLLLPKSSPSVARVTWAPLLRDGGARLNRSFALFDLTAQRDSRAMAFTSNPTSRSANRFVAGGNLSRIDSEPVDRWKSGKDDVWGATRSVGDVPSSTWLLGAGVVLAASAFDSQVDKWVVKHQASEAGRAAKIGSAIPFLMAAGSGVALTGLAGEHTANTAQTALLSAGVAVGANLGLKFAVGRARPLDGQGAAAFQGGNAGDSSFASNHMAAAFALATPFAQQYDMPSLYLLAAATGFGRMQQREHWLSDTVAGGLLGYAVGSLMSNQQLRREKGWKLEVSPSKIGATKSF